MLEIALDDKKEGVFQKDIAERQNISVKYLDNIIASLKTSGLIINKRGRKSGYILSRPASEINMLDIYKAFEPGLFVMDCISGNYLCDRSKICCVQNFWKGLNNQVISYFNSFTLEDLIREQKKYQFPGREKP